MTKKQALNALLDAVFEDLEKAFECGAYPSAALPEVRERYRALLAALDARQGDVAEALVRVATAPTVDDPWRGMSRSYLEDIGVLALRGEAR
jgi:DNA-binding FadR family transcriptional regulator